ncbi:ubinuclein-2a isoform X2 [Nelusetta ayraudi]|uniref:ubinuclein-2a isoform X2 n=1 Tax=Nelusetta ayraudi TaxID=303726 RepID=UPI003F70F638
MAEPRKVQFVTLSAFAAGAAADSRKRRLEDGADFNFGRGGAVEAATGAGGAAAAVAGGDRLGQAGDRAASAVAATSATAVATAVAEKRATVRLNLCLSEPDDRSSVEFNYGELIQNTQEKRKPPSVTPAYNPDDPFNDEERERLQVEALARKFENKYGDVGKKKRKDRMQDLIDIGFGYDETDPFIDNSEAYDELVPASLTTKLGGFYINTGTLQFRAASDSEGEGDKKPIEDKEQEMKKRKKKEASSLEEKNAKKNKVPAPGVAALSPHRPEKKKRKKLMKDSLYLAAMLRRFTREKEEMKRRNPNMVLLGLAGGEAHKPRPANNSSSANNHNSSSSSSSACNSTAHLQGGASAGSDLLLADLASDPAVMSLLGSANEKELQDLLGDLDFGLLDGEQQQQQHQQQHHQQQHGVAAAAAARENGVLGVGAPPLKGAVGVSGAGGGGGGVQGRGPGPSSGLFSPPPLPDRLPAPLIKRIEDLRAASRQFDQEGRKKFFTLDMNNILLDIELQAQEQPPAVRLGIYSHMEAFVPCNKEALLKRLKKLSFNIQDDRLRTPLLKLKLAVCSVMPEQIAKYNMDCMAKVAKQQQSEEGDKNGSEEEDEEKPGKRIMGPRKKFVWDDKLRNLLCSVVRVKLSCYEMENQCSLSVEDYLKAFLENEVKPLWPKGWMQARILLKESLSVHCHLTGSLVKRRMVPGPKSKTKEGLWIQKAPLALTSGPSLPAAAPPTTAPTSGRPAMALSPSEPICLSDSLDEELSAPSLDSISHALALLSNASKGLGPPDSPLSPLQVPTSSPPPVTPHYPSASQLAAAAAAAHQHSSSRAETTTTTTTTTAPGATALPTPSPTSTPSPSVTAAAAVARVQAGGGLSLASRTANGPYGVIKAAGQSQTHKLPSSNHRPSAVIGGGGKMHPHPSPSPPKQRPPPTASPLLPPHQKSFASVAGAALGAPGLTKVGAKVGSSNGGTPPSPAPPARPNASFCPPSSLSPAPQGAHPHQAKAHPLPRPPHHAHHAHHHHHQPNFITPMQATLTKSPHSSSSSPIIKLTPRPPAPTPPPSSSPAPPSSSPSPSPSHPPLSHHMMAGQQQQQQQQFAPKTFRPTFSAQVKVAQGGCSFAGSPKTQSSPSSNSSSGGSKGALQAAAAPEKTPTSSAASVLANHGQRQRAVGGASQSSKAGNGWAASGSLATPPTTSHLSQVSSAGSSLLGSPTPLPLGFGMLGGLVPVSLPFQFPPLLSFSPPGGPGAGGMGSAPSSNSGYPLAQSDLMDLYKSLQSGSQAALPPHLQLAFSDANQSQGGGDMKRKSH